MSADGDAQPASEAAQAVRPMSPPDPPPSLVASQPSDATSEPSDAAPRDTSPERGPYISGGGDGQLKEGGSAGRSNLALRAKRKAVTEAVKLGRPSGAIIAPSRTAEGYTLAAGSLRSCLPDAAYNGIHALDPSFEPSLARLRTLSIPQIGNVLEACWASLNAALGALGYPFEAVEATARFETAEGGPMLNLLKAPPAVFLVALRVKVGGKVNKHAAMVSTLHQKHAPFGKLVDNHGRMRPVYVEKRDRVGKKAAKAAFRKFVGQNPAIPLDAEYTVETAEVYELVRTGCRRDATEQAAEATATAAPKRARLA